MSRLGRRPHGWPGRERGVAIITAMLVVALGTITIVAITSRQQLDMQRERNEALIQQARNLAVSGERFAAATLFRDIEDADRGNSDSLDDDWAQTIPPIPIDNAAIKGCIIDMQGRFNLNNVVANGAKVPQYIDQLKRLLAELNIDVTKADAIADWADSDFEATIPDGAEDDYYSGLDPGYRAANRPFTSVTELQLVKGFSPAVEDQFEDYELLLPHIAALPQRGKATPISLNTATPQVIASMDERLKPLAQDLTRWDTLAYEDYPECEDIFDLDPETGPATEEAGEERLPAENEADFFKDVPPVAGQTIAANIERGVTSSFFQVRIDVATEGITLSQYTLLEREGDGRTRVILRSRDAL